MCYRCDRSILLLISSYSTDRFCKHFKAIFVTLFVIIRMLHVAEKNSYLGLDILPVNAPRLTVETVPEAPSATGKVKLLSQPVQRFNIIVGVTE